jgi:hypothetical protein
LTEADELETTGDKVYKMLMEELLLEMNEHELQCVLLVRLFLMYHNIRNIAQHERFDFIHSLLRGRLARGGSFL